MHAGHSYMKSALELARKAFDEGEVPVGAVIVDAATNKIIAEGYNQCEARCNATHHAEILAITEACRIKQNKFLEGCHMYVTLEPCLMCATAISYARISRIYYGAADHKFGAIENGPRIFCGKGILYKPEIYSGIMADEGALLMKDFFKALR